MLSEISYCLFSKELNFVFEFCRALCQKSLALEDGWSKQSGFCMMIFINLVWTITFKLDMILGCLLLWVVDNYFYFKKYQLFASNLHDYCEIWVRREHHNPIFMDFIWFVLLFLFFFIFAFQLFEPSFGLSEVPLKRFGHPHSKDFIHKTRVNKI